jgi:hypothetical protein
VRHAIQQSTSHWFEFETEVPSQGENLDSLNRIHRELLAKVEAMDSPQRVVPDMDTEIPVCGEQEHSACNGHFEPTCYHPLSQFDGEGDRLAANLPPEKVPSAEDCDEALLSEVERQNELSKEVVSRGDAACAKPDSYEAPEKPGVMQRFPSDSTSVPEPPNEHAIYQACGADMAVAGEMPALWQPAGAATTITQRVKRVLLKPRWNVAVAAVVFTALVIACWIAYSDRHPASPLGASALQRSNALEQQVPFVSAKQLPENSTTKPQTAPVATEEARAARTTPQRVRVGENEVEIGEDVTVRYFAPKPAVVPPTGPVPSAAQPADRSLPVPETSVSPKPAQ